MKYTFSIRHFFLFSFFFATSALANQFANPYQGNIPVLGRSESVLKELALKQVLVKVSGNKEVTELPESKSLLTKTDNLLSQYGYHVYQGRRHFMAIFDSNEINKTLRMMQQPIWGETRPVTLIWLVNDDRKSRQFVSDNILGQQANNQMSTVLQDQQHNRGISLQFPLIDLEDSLALSISDVAGRFYDQVASASERYSAEHFVIANLKQKSAQNWSLTWELVQSKSAGQLPKVLVTNSLSGRKLSLLSQMTNEIADYYAGQYAILENQGGNFSQTIFVNKIKSLEQYSQLGAVLDKLNAVASYKIVSVQNSEVTVDIKINGGLESFKNGLYAQPNLQSDTALSETFYFNWQ